VGRTPITAVYGGDANYIPNVCSKVVTITVKAKKTAGAKSSAIGVEASLAAAASLQTDMFAAAVAWNRPSSSSTDGGSLTRLYDKALLMLDSRC
jgi:hypothetical protein